MIEDLWFRYPRQSHDVLAGVDLRIDGPTSCAVVGPSGCGKSTLLGLVAGHLIPERGSVSIDDTSVSGKHPSALARSSTVAWILQDAALLPRRTVLDNVTLPAILGGVARDEAEVAALELLDKLGMAGTAHMQARTLSGGQSQRLATARALIRRPRILLADEPTANLDVATAREVGSSLISVAQTHTVVLISTHDPHIARLCEHRLELAPGG